MLATTIAPDLPSGDFVLAKMRAEWRRKVDDMSSVQTGSRQPANRRTGVWVGPEYRSPANDRTREQRAERLIKSPDPHNKRRTNILNSIVRSLKGFTPRREKMLVYFPGMVLKGPDGRLHYVTETTCVPHKGRHRVDS